MPGHLIIALLAEALRCGYLIVNAALFMDDASQSRTKSLIINLSVLVILMLSGNQRDVLPPRYRVFGTNRKLTARPKC